MAWNQPTYWGVWAIGLLFVTNYVGAVGGTVGPNLKRFSIAVAIMFLISALVQ